jgi:hypothetical protein
MKTNNKKVKIVLKNNSSVAKKKLKSAQSKVLKRFSL